ncbi:MAG: outer membrane protein transport protein [Pirellulaceae bacterium]|nr:outer membrane protein transport protein [Pirellulaceae bacterium]
MMRSLFNCLCLFAIFGLPGRTIYAESIAPSVDAKAAGRGGANFAFSDNGYILHDNPSGLLGNFGSCSNQRKHFVDASLVGLFPDLQYSDPQNSKVNASNDPFGMGAFTVGRRIADDVALGFGVYSPAGFGARWNLEGPPGPLAGPQLYKSLGMLIRVLPGISFQATDRLRIGANLGVAISHIELEGPYFINSLPLTGTPTSLDLQSTGTALTWATGFQYQAADNLILAARYQSQNRFQNNGNARIAIPGLGLSSYDMTMDIVWPRSVGGGFQYAIAPNRRLALDVDWQQWSTAKNEIGLRFEDPSNPVFQNVAGPVVRESFPLQWKDSIVVKAGLEQDVSPNRTVRIGYGYNSDAVVSQTTTTYLPTILSHYFSGGYTWRRFCWEYNLAYQYSFRPTMHIGTSSLAGGDFSNSSLSTQAHWLFLGASKKF